MSHDDMIAVIQAAKQGEQIEARRKRNDDRWDVQAPPVAFNFVDIDYRVKPEPREFWLLLGYSGDTARVFTGSRPDNTWCSKFIHVREVLE